MVIEANTSDTRTAGTQLVTEAADLRRAQKSWDKVTTSLRADGTVDGTMMPAMSAIATHFHLITRRVVTGLGSIADVLDVKGQALGGVSDQLDANDQQGRTSITSVDPNTNTGGGGQYQYAPNDPSAPHNVEKEPLNPGPDQRGGDSSQGGGNQFTNPGNTGGGGDSSTDPTDQQGQQTTPGTSNEEEPPKKDPSTDSQQRTPDDGATKNAPPQTFNNPGGTPSPTPTPAPTPTPDQRQTPNTDDDSTTYV